MRIINFLSIIMIIGIAARMLYTVSTIGKAQPKFLVVGECYQKKADAELGTGLLYITLAVTADGRFHKRAVYNKGAKHFYVEEDRAIRVPDSTDVTAVKCPEGSMY